MVRCTFSPARAWRLAVDPASTETLDRTNTLLALLVSHVIHSQHACHPPDLHVRGLVLQPSRPAAKTRIDIRIRRLSLGNPGDVKPVGEGVSELRVDYGPGYRVYFIKRANLYVVLLAGGDKSSQANDVIKAKALAREL